MFGPVDVDQGAEQVAVLGRAFVIGPRSEHRTWLVAKDIVAQFDRQDVCMARDCVEGVEVVVLDEMYRIFPAQNGTRLVKEIFVGVRSRGDKYLSGFLD
jgi:hypothetical protein